jgi:hypothetical protein
MVRIHVPKYSEITAPLTSMTKKDRGFDWTAEAQQAFDTLKQKIGEDIRLKKIDYEPGHHDIIFAVDTSPIAAGAAIFQLDGNGVRHPARYESVTLTDTESRYSQAKRELCGLVKCLKKVAHHLWGIHFVVEVDAISLVQMVNSPDPVPNAAANRWISYLKLFDFEVRHVPATKHKLPDGLSRVRRTSSDSSARQLTDLLSNGAFLGPPLSIETVPLSAFPITFQQERYPDPIWKALGRYLLRLVLPAGFTRKQKRKIKNMAERHYLRNGRIFVKAMGSVGPREVIIDEQEQNRILNDLHDEGGHRGARETYVRVSKRFFFPKMLSTIERYVKTCKLCQLRSPRKETEKRKPTIAPGLFRCWTMDVVHIKYGRYPYLVTAHDDLTGWVEAEALTKADSKHIARFIEGIICRFGKFARARIDNGSEFKSEAEKVLTSRGIKISRIAPSHPEANGGEESKHKQLVDCIYKLCREHPASWHRYLPFALFAERISVKRSTGFSPYQLIYLTEPILPVDLELDTWLMVEWDSIQSKSDLLLARARQLLQRHEDMDLIATKLHEARLKSVLYHDKVNAHRLRQPLQAGDLVLVENVLLEHVWGRKLDDRWYGPYEILERLAKGSYLLKELGHDGAHLVKPFAAKRLRRFYARGRSEESIDGDMDEEEQEGNEEESEAAEVEAREIEEHRIRELVAGQDQQMQEPEEEDYTRFEEPYNPASGDSEKATTSSGDFIGLPGSESAAIEEEELPDFTRAEQSPNLDDSARQDISPVLNVRPLKPLHVPNSTPNGPVLIVRPFDASQGAIT